MRRRHWRSVVCYWLYGCHWSARRERAPLVARRPQRLPDDERQEETGETLAAESKPEQVKKPKPGE